jgi:hypothetical protein
MDLISNLDRTICSDFSLQLVVDENNAAVHGHCRAIKVRLVGAEVHACKLSGRVVRVGVLYANPSLKHRKTRSRCASGFGEF